MGKGKGQDLLKRVVLEKQNSKDGFFKRKKEEQKEKKAL